MLGETDREAAARVEAARKEIKCACVGVTRARPFGSDRSAKVAEDGVPGAQEFRVHSSHRLDVSSTKGDTWDRESKFLTLQA